MRARRNLLALAVLGAGLLLVPPAPASAAGAAPAPPVLVGPATGSTQVPPSSRLQVTASDPDDASLEVTYYGRPRAGTSTPNSSAPFTLMVLPDTQNYVSVAANRPIMGQQTQWIVNSRQQLNTAFVTQVGDLVGTPTNASQWQVASQYLATLDSNGVPNAVLPGNHDLDLATGAAPLYQQYFPVSRYAGASWNSATAAYGGFMGKNQFGADPVDRQNMNNYALFTAGGMDFLLLSLEFNTPDYSIDWAKKVIAAYPNRRTILSTHSFVDFTGAISPQMNRGDGGNSPQQLWQKLVSTNCGIFMVVSGHFHDGDLSEARRTDTNACGKPVLSMLSDYQERVNGGNGWLRYYTFKPATNQIQAVTYSPSLNQYETDADSAFTLPYDMSTRSQVPFSQLGRATVATGSTASVPVPDLPAGTEYEWYATVGDGTSTTTGPTWTFTTAAAQPSVLAADTFTRTTSNTWGVAETGGTYTMTGTTSRFSVAGGQGVHTVPAGAQVGSQLNSFASTATDLSVRFALDAVPNATSYVWVSGRRSAAGEYGAKVKVASSGAVSLVAARGDTELAGGVLPGVTLLAGQALNVRVQVEGTSPTTIRTRAWKQGTAEPSTWQALATDSTAGLQAGGGVRVGTYLSSTAGNGPVVVRFDDLLARPLGGTPAPANQPPAAAFSASTSGLTASLDASASGDPDGTVVGYAWTFGDGGTATGASPTHTYAAAGTYPVTLTVTDDDSATGTRTSQVSVSTPPAATILAEDAFSRTVTNGWGGADPGGAWSIAAGAERFSVGTGTGVQLVPAGVRATATLAGVSSSATDLSTRLSLDAVPNGAVSVSIVGRAVGAAEYAARVRVQPTGAVELHLERSGTAVGGGTLAGITLAAGQALNVRVQVQGTSPTTVRARAWKVGTAEPSTWATSLSDATTGLQAAGAVRISTYLSSATTSGPVTARFDDVRAARLP